MMKADHVLTEWVRFRDHYEGATVNDFANTVGMKLDTVQTVLRRARAKGDSRGEAVFAPRRPTRPRFDTVLKAWNEADPASTYAEVAETLGTSASAVCSVAYRARREGREVRPAVLGGPAARRLHAVAEEWRFLREAGTSIHEAANRLGVSVETLRRIP